MCGLVQEANAAPSSEHWNDELVSDDENEKLAELDATVPDGPESIAESGHARKTVIAGVRAERLPAASNASTANA